MPSSWILIPGYGAQGGSAADVAPGFDAEGLGAIVNSSRGIIFAYDSKRYGKVEKWQEAVEASTKEMIQALRENAKEASFCLKETSLSSLCECLRLLACGSCIVFFRVLPIGLSLELNVCETYAPNGRISRGQTGSLHPEMEATADSFLLNSNG